MKDNLEKSLTKLLVKRLIIYICLITLGFAAFFVLAYTVFFNFLIDLTWMMAGGNYYNVMDLKYVIFFGLYGLCIIFAVYRIIRRAVNFVVPVVDAVDTVFAHREEEIILPEELKSVEAKMNAISRNMIRSEQNAREAEQRKNDLVVYLAHDLKTPLTSIIGYLSLLEESPELPAKQRAKYTGIALDKAYRLEDLINEFFEITRFNLQNIALDMKRTDISMLVYQVAEEFHPMVSEKGLSLELNVAQNIAAVCDAEKMARVLDNLLRNAVSYSYPNSQILVGLQHDSDNIILSVQNYGDEIPAEKLERIFEKFFRADSSRMSRTGGAGLGLAIAKQIVTLHGGKITAQSRNGYTQFTVVLPVKA